MTKVIVPSRFTKNTFATCGYAEAIVVPETFIEECLPDHPISPIPELDKINRWIQQNQESLIESAKTKENKDDENKDEGESNLWTPPQ